MTLGPDESPEPARSPKTDTHPAFVCDHLLVRKARAHGRNQYIAEGGGAGHVLVTKHPVSRLRGSGAIGAFMFVLLGIMFGSISTQHWLGQGAVFLVVVFSSLLGALALSYLALVLALPRWSLAIRLGGLDGNTLLFIRSVRRVQWFTWTFSVTDSTGNAIGSLIRRDGIGRAHWRALRPDGTLHFTAVDPAVLRAWWFAFADGILHSGQSNTRPVLYDIVIPDGSSAGFIFRCIHGPGTAGMYLCDDPESGVDRRLAIALAIQMAVASVAILEA